jgi:asparagine synthase (glutamine-hydrolysing)
MSYRYIALSAHLAGNPDDREGQLACRLNQLGMVARGSIGPLVLFTPKDVPILDLPGGGVLLGDLYGRSGKPIADLTGLQDMPSQAALRQHLLSHFWGEYLLFQASDEGEDAISLMRDPSGGMACAYALHGEKGFITSDLAIASHLGLHRDLIDWDFVQNCLIHPHIKTARTGLGGVRELLPGCMLWTNGNNFSTTTVWSPWSFVAPAQRQTDFNIASQMIREVITSVVQTMATTDRSLLLELSGGLDSSIVGACLAKTQARVACCTAITPLPGADERRYAAQIAALLGIDLLERTLDFADTDIKFALPQHSLRPAVWALGRAVGRAIDSAAESQQVNSLFSGGGGDTVFCYLTTAAPAADAFREQGLAAGYRAVVNLSRLHGCTLTKATRLTLRKLWLKPKPPYKPNHLLLANSEESAPLEIHPWYTAPPQALPGDRERIFDLAGNQLFSDSIVRAGGRRVRMPLLSQPVMEACLRVPSWMWITAGQNRAVARAAFSQQLPSEVLRRRSKGTFMNYTFAMYRRNKQTIGRFLLDGHLQSNGLLDSHKLKLLLESPMPGRDQSFMRIFDLCMIENWVRNHA